MWYARWMLLCLWLSQVARVTADNALRLFVVLSFAALGAAQRNSAWHLATILLMVPAVLFAPFNGALCNSLPKPRVLIGSAAFGLAAVALFAWWGGDWMWCWGLIALSMAVYGPARYALLPAAAIDTRLPLTRINGFFELGAAAAIIVGAVVGFYERDSVWWLDVPAPIVLAVALNAATLLFALPVLFPSDVYRPESARQAVRDFFLDARSIWAEPEARVCLIGLGGLRGLITGMIGALLPRFLAGDGPGEQELVWIGIWLAAGMGLGSLLAGLQRHPRRVLGLVPIGAAGLALGLIWAAADVTPGAPACVVFGIMAGLINVPLATAYQIALPADARGNGMAVRGLTDYVCNALAAGVLFVLARYFGVPTWGQLWIIAALATLGALAAWWTFRRPIGESLIELLFAGMYRFRAAGPGLHSFPTRGPVLVVANHSAWPDPLWLGKVLPRTLIPMMGSGFFDLPLLRWVMVYLAQAIRIDQTRFRRDVPELREAVAALDAGQCVVIFPEGELRKKQERPLKMFGRGVWHILKERPQTPVVVCWIEGGWGSYFSYQGGPPTKEKRHDVRRPIGIAVGVAQLLPAATLADQRATRVYLMQECLRRRGDLGLEPYALSQLEGEDSAAPASDIA